MSEYTVSFSFGPDTDPDVDCNANSAVPENQITFLCDPPLEGQIPAPGKAIRAAPQWFKDLEREMDVPMENGLPGLTAKACLPMADAFALGFVLPLPFDVFFRVPEGRGALEISWSPDLPFQPVEQHHPGQLGAPNPPFEQAMPLKFINPWRIKVPDGYSVLMTQPLNRPDLPFTVFSGFVDCDRFATTINMPFLWTGPPGDITLPAGLPIAQLIPIRRDGLIKTHEVRASTAQELAEQTAASEKKYSEESAYAREWRAKK